MVAGGWAIRDRQEPARHRFDRADPRPAAHAPPHRGADAAVGQPLTDDDLVFCGDAAQPRGRHVTSRQLKPLLRDPGLPPIGFHDLRRTFASLQLAAGTNPKIVSEVLGHEEVAITLDRYSHACPCCRPGPWPASTASWAGRRADRRAARTRSRQSRNRGEPPVESDWVRL